MIIAKIIAAVFAILVLVKSYDEFRRGREPLPVFLVWLVIWLAVLFAAFFPGLTEVLRARILGPGTGLGTVLGIGIVFVLFISYRLYLKADRIERELNQLVSKLAIRDFESKD